MTVVKIDFEERGLQPILVNLTRLQTALSSTVSGTTALAKGLGISFRDAQVSDHRCRKALSTLTINPLERICQHVRPQMPQGVEHRGSEPSTMRSPLAKSVRPQMPQGVEHLRRWP